MDGCKKDVIPVHQQWSYISFAITHRVTSLLQSHEVTFLLQSPMELHFFFNHLWSYISFAIPCGFIHPLLQSPMELHLFCNYLWIYTSCIHISFAITHQVTSLIQSSIAMKDNFSFTDICYIITINLTAFHFNNKFVRKHVLYFKSCPGTAASQIVWHSKLFWFDHFDQIFRGSFLSEAQSTNDF